MQLQHIKHIEGLIVIIDFYSVCCQIYSIDAVYIYMIYILHVVWNHNIHESQLQGFWYNYVYKLDSDIWKSISECVALQKGLYFDSPRSFRPSHKDFLGSLQPPVTWPNSHVTNCERLSMWESWGSPCEKDESSLASKNTDLLAMKHIHLRFLVQM